MTDRPVGHSKVPVQPVPTTCRHNEVIYSCTMDFCLSERPFECDPYEDLQIEKSNLDCINLIKLQSSIYICDIYFLCKISKKAICAHDYESSLSQNLKTNEFITYFTPNYFKVNLFDVIFTILSKKKL